LSDLPYLYFHYSSYHLQDRLIIPEIKIHTLYHIVIFYMLESGYIAYIKRR